MTTPPTQPITLRVNGRYEPIASSLDTPLLLALRNDLGLVGAKVGCALSQCGVCTVLADGEPVRSCVTPVGDVAGIGAAITTIEGIGQPGALHRVQRAFEAEAAAQCGYCIPGIMMEAVALLERTPDPSDEDIHAALAGNICRCGAHPRILRAIHRAARDTTPDPPVRPAFPAPSLVVTTALAAADDTSGSDPGEHLGGGIHLHPDSRVTVLSGKVEIGTGLRTAMTGIVAGALGVPAGMVNVIAGDTARTPDQGTTAGSKSIQSAGMDLARAARLARQRLLDRAAHLLEIPATDLDIQSGRVVARHDARIAVPVGELIGLPDPEPPPADPVGPDAAADHAQDDRASRQDDGQAAARLEGANQAEVVTPEPIRRVDIPGKLTGRPSYVHDLRLPGMLHARVVRPMARTIDGMGATVRTVDRDSIAGMPGIVDVIHSGDLVAVVAERDEQALRAAQQLRVEWDTVPLPPFADRFAAIRSGPTVTQDVRTTGDPAAAISGAAQTHSADYAHPWQAHASIGPSAAVADVRPDRATVWCSSQGVFSLRQALAPTLGLPEEAVRVVHVEGPGCYGHNGADDVAGDAAVISQIVGRPVRVIWSRQGEFAWEGKGPAMVHTLRAGLDRSGAITGWEMDVWTPTHSTRPSGHAGNLLAAQTRDPAAPLAPLGRGGGTRNAATTYTFPAQRVTAHWVMEPALRPSALRSLGGLANTTANEQFMDELAHRTGQDPVAFRRRHLDDPRAIAVLDAVAERAGWRTPLATPADGALAGRGIAFARYEGEYAYAAVIAEVRVTPDTGAVRVDRIVVAHDCGEIVSADGVRAQIEGNVIQGVSRALKEEVIWDESGVTSLDWETYPVLRFDEVPVIEVVLIDRPDRPAWGAGEPAICPVPAAIGNALFAATGVRFRQTPFTPERVLAGLRESAST
ncbi:MAG TPA: molybdopterin cofactor-binding domain-containing protein [Thermomicrobiales bacterium]|nr:molybdopterin cofactor-binding domain-containing protein [Thermomicrobiales bacterium]